MLSKVDADLLYADQMCQFVVSNLDQQTSEISQELKIAFQTRVLKRRQTKVIHLMEYLRDPRFLDQNQDFFGNRIVKSDVSKLASSLLKRLFPDVQVEADVPQ